MFPMLNYLLALQVHLRVEDERVDEAVASAAARVLAG